MGYVDLWLGDVRERIIRNLIYYAEDSCSRHSGDPHRGEVYMTTVTAPGSDVLPWRCLGRHPEAMACSGKWGCITEPTAAVAWNLTADTRMTRLHASAMEATRRRFGAGTLRRLVIAPEPQRRGVIHWHIILAADTARSRAAAKFYTAKLAALSPTHGFGFVDRHLKATHAGRAAHYIAKYLTDSAKAGHGLRDLVLAGQAPARAVHVHRELTVETRVTARLLRARRAVYMAYKIELDCREVEALQTLVVTFGCEVLRPDEVPAAWRLESAP